MAFLCPSRRGRQKKKHKEPKAPFMGRITGSASIDTLVRVGLEKQHGLAPDSRMRVTQDFLATRKDELGAQQGETLYKLYQDGDWVYAITEAGQEGFIPTICVTPLSDRAPSSGKSKRNSYTADAENNRTSLHSNNNFALQNGSAHRNRLSGSNQLSRQRNASSCHDVSMKAETGSDVSTPSLSKDCISPDTINPLPKPSRSQSNIPDVVSTTNNPQNKSTTTNVHANNVKSSHNPNQNFKENNRDLINSLGSHGNVIQPLSAQKDKRLSSQIDDVDSKHTLSPEMANPGHRSSHASNGDSITEVKTFVKKMSKKLLVVFSFTATDENDVTVERGEVISVLNDKDPHWTWVKKRNGKEGFVPRAFMCSIPDNLLPNSGSTGKPDARPKDVMPRPVQYHDVRELYTLGHFNAQSADDISVQAGEQVFADLANQIEQDWLWVYAPANQCYGYIPKDNVTLPRESQQPSPNVGKHSYHRQ